MTTQPPLPRVDVSAERCPMTWVRTKVALARLAPGATLEVLLGAGEMLENVPRNVVDDGHELLSLAPAGDGRHLMTIRRRSLRQENEPMVSIRIPTPLRSYTADKEEVQVEGATLRAALADLDKRAPGLRERIMNEKGALRPYINVFLNDDDVRFGDGLDSALKDGDKLAIVPAIAGG